MVEREKSSEEIFLFRAANIDSERVEQNIFHLKKLIALIATVGITETEAQLIFMVAFWLQ